MVTAMRHIAAACLLGILYGCAAGDEHYSLTPPDSENGRSCAAQCAAGHDRCRSEEGQRARDLYRQCLDQGQQILRQCQIQAEAEFEACESSARAKAEAQARQEARARAKEEAKARAKSTKGKARDRKAEAEKATQAKKEKSGARLAQEAAKAKSPPPEPCELQRCAATTTCYDTPTYGLCDTDFHHCYQACGGQVRYLNRGELDR